MPFVYQTTDICVTLPLDSRIFHTVWRYTTHAAIERVSHADQTRKINSRDGKHTDGADVRYSYQEAGWGIRDDDTLRVAQSAICKRYLDLTLLNKLRVCRRFLWQQPTKHIVAISFSGLTGSSSNKLIFTDIFIGLTISSRTTAASTLCYYRIMTVKEKLSQWHWCQIKTFVAHGRSWRWIGRVCGAKGVDWSF